MALKRLGALGITVLLAACGGLSGAGDEASSSVLPSLEARNDRLVDAQGREVILRGLNHIGLRSNRLRPPLRQDDGSPTPREELFDLQDLRDEDFDRIAAMGFNVLRTVFTWEFAQPDPPPAPYNEDYFALIDEFLDKAAARGIYVVFNFGQFGWSRAAGGNAGAPEWTVSDVCAQFPQIPGAPPQIPGGCSFFNFWANQESPGVPIRDAYIDLWRFVVERYRDHPAVVIYDLFNEPYGGPIPSGVFETVYLYPFYRELAAAIREIDPDTVIGFQPSLLHSIGVPTPFAEPINIPNALYMPHEYTIAYFTQRVDPRYLPGQRLVTEGYVTVAEDEARTFGTPWLTGETGWTRTTEADGVGGPIEAVNEQAPREYARDLNVIANTHRIGWIWFAYSSIDPAYGINFGGDLDEALVAAMAQPYPRATAGRVEEIHFDPVSGAFLLRTTDRFDAVTEIALPLRWQYPDGACVYGDSQLVGSIDGFGGLERNARAAMGFDPVRQTLQIRPLPAELTVLRRSGGCPRQAVTN